MENEECHLKIKRLINLSKNKNVNKIIPNNKYLLNVNLKSDH